MKKIAMTAIAAALAFSAPVFADDAHHPEKAAEASLALPKTPAERLSHARAPMFMLGLLGLFFLLVEGWSGRFALSLDMVNLIVLFLALLLHRNAASLLAHVEDAARPLHGIVLQFPLYAGIYGVIKDTGLADRLAQVFLSVATTDSLPGVVFAYSAFLNYLSLIHI